MINIKKGDIMRALQETNFFERVINLSKSFRNSFPEARPRIDKKQVNEIIRNLGYTPGYIEKYFCLKNQLFENVSFEVWFNLKNAYVDVSWYVYEEGELIYGGPWLKLKRDLLKDCNCNGGPLPSFGSYGELEEILSIMFKMYEDFKNNLLKEKGISISEG